MKDSGFFITQGKGFRITTESGWSISVQFGHHNYCDNYILNTKIDRDDADDIDYGEKGCANAEIAIIDPEGALQQLSIPDGDTVKGYCTPKDVFELIEWLAYK
jgi:hypothetical protein